MTRQESNLLMVLITFILLFLLFGGLGGWFYYKTEAAPNPEKEFPGGQRYVYEKTLQERVDLETKIAQLDLEIAKMRKDIEAAELVYHNMLHRLDVTRMEEKVFLLINENTRTHVDNQRRVKGEIQDYLTRGMDEATRAYVKEGLRERRSEREREFEQVRSKLKSQIEEVRARIQKEQEETTRLLEQLRAERSRLETKHNQAQEELRKFTARERQVVDVEPDGSILNAVFATKTAVIDIGESDGVKRGFRFEVFQLLGGVNRVSKGFLEVRSTRAEVSSCTILERVIELPRCANCGYTARIPEEQFCPYCTGGTSGIGVARLSATPKRLTFGMNPENPITPGDFIWNPLFRPGKPMKVVYAGDPLAANRYSRQYIRDTIVWYGNALIEQVGADADLVVAGRLAADSAEAARELGVDLIYEFELFPFLRR